jgi:hypothetical protein
VEIRGGGIKGVYIKIKTLLKALYTETYQGREREREREETMAYHNIIPCM